MRLWGCGFGCYGCVLTLLGVVNLGLQLHCEVFVMRTQVLELVGCGFLLGWVWLECYIGWFQ